jgi:putative tricarboxylic transport membrane protein
MFDVLTMGIFGVLGYLFKKLKYPMAPLVLALVLGDMAETNFRQALLGSQGSLGVFFGSPLSGSLMVLALVMLFWPLLGLLRRRAAPATTSGPTPEPEPVKTSA